jgi:signal transduction histidine kinase
MPTGGRLAVTTGVAPTGSPAGAPEGASANGASANGGAATAWIEVRDTGPGMDPELRDRAFEPYVTTKATRGAGLGLAEAYGVMCRHRGRIELDTMPGRGTVVRLVFPHVPPSARGAAPGTAPGDPV